MASKPSYEELAQRVRQLEQDAEKRIQIEAALRESEHQINQFLAIAGVIFVALDDGGNITLINECGLETLGYRREELLGKNWIKTCLPHGYQKDIFDVYQQLMKDEIEPVEYYENPILRKDGEERIIAWHNTILKDPEGKTVGVLSSGEDITERLKTEKRLREAYEIIKRSPAVTFLWKNVEGWPVEFVSENVMDLLGYSADDFISGRVLYTKVVHPDDLERVTGEVANVSIGKKQKRFTHEPYRIVAKDGKIKWLADRTYIRRDEKGKITHYQGVVLDITERKLAERALRESEERYRSLFQNNHAAMLLIDPDSANIIDANPAAVMFYGWALKELTQKKITDINTLSSGQVFQEMELAKAEQRRQFNFRHRLATGKTVDVEVYSGPIIINGKKLLYSIVHDISSRKRAEKALMTERNKLQEALAKIKTLSGMLPICSNCKKIRDDKGYWNQIEGYIQEHSDAEFSHGICPECAKKLYPDLNIYGD